MFKGNFPASYLTEEVHLYSVANTIFFIVASRLQEELHFSEADYLVEQGIASPASTASKEEDIEGLKITLQEHTF